MSCLSILAKKKKKETHNPEAVITGDEMISSAFPMKEVDNAVYESTCQLVQVKKSSAVGAYWTSLKILVSLAIFGTD